MKKRTALSIKIAGVAVILAAVAFLLQDASDTFRFRAYDPNAPTKTKLGLIARFLPPGSDLYVAVDVPRVMASPEFNTKIAAMIQGREGVIAELVDALVNQENTIGMIMFAFSLGDKETKPAIAAIAQGRFDPEQFIPNVRMVMAQGRGGLASEIVGDLRIYSEADERDPFAFVLLDDKHIAVGKKDSLVQLFSAKPAEDAQIADPADSIVVGHLNISERIRAILPPEISGISGADMWSIDGSTIFARFACADAVGPEKLGMFIEGIRSLIMLQEEGNKPLISLLGGVDISKEQGSLVLSCPTDSIIGLWADSN